ncbi:VWA domain-containing protein [soil metagenome]
MLLRRTFPALALAAALVAGCSSESASGPNTIPGRPGSPTTQGPPRVDLDPERYVLDYESTSVDQSSSGSGKTYSSPSGTTAAAGDEAGSPVPPRVPTPYEDNTFVGAGHHPFVAVDDQPTSSFGLDVDTGSLSVGRTFLESGTLPPPDSVRTEEWVNALGSDQDGPTGDAIGVQVDTAPSAFTDATRMVRVGVAAQDLSAEDRPPANLTFVVDTSGSMDIRERLGLVKASLGLLVLNLRDDDTIAIVQYSDEAGVVLEPTEVEDADRIVAAIDDLQPSNSTNLEAGLREGYRQAAAAFQEDGLNAVILASDGVANVGLTDPDGLAGVIQDRADDGIHLVTVGYGMGNYDDDLMEQVADQGDGFYAYLDTYAQAEKLFRDRLTSTLAVVATDAKAQVRFDPAVVEQYRQVGYENRALTSEEFDDDATDAGEIGAGHRVTALYEVRLRGTTKDRAPDTVLGGVKVRYRDAESGQIHATDQPIVLGGATKASEAPADARFQAATAAFAEWLAAPGSKADLAAVRTEAAAAAKDLPEGGLPGSVATPAEVLRLMDQAAKASPAPAETSYED